MPLILSPTQIAFNAKGDGLFHQPIPAQVDFFRGKLNLPTAHFDDVLKSGHDRGFMVAGAMKADLISDLRGAVDRSIAEGKSFGWFQQNFEAIVKKQGWEGWTGSDSKAGRDWRARVIYQTNMSASYAAGRWAKLTDPELLQVLPYWKYLHNDSVMHPRPLHKAWSGTVLPANDPWFLTHFAPNGWGCHCRVEAVSASEYHGDPAPDDGTYQVTDRFGVVHTVPNGIDYGWDYAPGAKQDVSLRQSVQDKLIRYKPAITRALTRDVNRYVNANEDVSKFAARVLGNKDVKESLWLGFVENPSVISKAIDFDTTGYLVLLPSDAINHVEKHHKFDGGEQRAATSDDYQQLWRVLAEGDISGGDDSATGLKRIVAKLNIDGELFRAVFEVRTGRNNRALSLVSLVIRTASR